MLSFAKFSIVVLSIMLAFLQVCYAQDAGYPECSNSCFASLPPMGSCSASDNACLCTNTDFVAAMRSCFESSCDAPNAKTSVDYAKSLCDQAGAPARAKRTLVASGRSYPIATRLATAQEAAATAFAIAPAILFACATDPSSIEPTAADNAKPTLSALSLQGATIPTLDMISTTAFGLVLASLLGASTASAKPSLTLSTFGPASVSDVSALKITTSIKNTGTEALRLLNDPNSALSTWETDSFQVARAESNLVTSPSLNFTGIRVKYSPTAAVKSGKTELFTVIAPGATFNVTHSLTSTYDFTGKGGGAGKYKLRASARARTFLSVGADGSITSLEATEEDVAEVAVSGRLSGPRLQPGARGAAHGSGPFQEGKSASKRALFRGCNDAQISQTLDAASRADNMAHGAHGFLRDGPWGTRRYTEWFGAWDQGRYNLVFGHYDAIRFNPPNFNYDCTCTDDGIYAYVIIPGHFQEIYLCGAFWRAPLEGTDSKAGTIIHEASHFPEYAGTSDHAYGQGAARDLARNDPGRAVMNADSHEYFAENEPWLGQ